MTDKEKQIFDKYGNYNFPTDIKQSGQNIATTQIEEMAKVIESVKLYGIDNYGRKISHDSVLELAEELLRHYQPKIPEGSVVLSKEEYAKDFCSQFNKGYERGSKETAREILDFGRKFFKNYNGHYNEGFSLFMAWIETQIENGCFAKQFGVEVENENY